MINPVLDLLKKQSIITTEKNCTIFKNYPRECSYLLSKLIILSALVNFIYVLILAHLYFLIYMDLQCGCKISITKLL